MLPAISVNKGCCSPQPLQPFWKVSHEETQDGGKWAASCQPSADTVPSPQRCTPRRLRVRKHRILALEFEAHIQRNDFSEPRLLHLLV